MSSNTRRNEPSSEDANPLIVENQRLRNKIFKLSNENVGLENIIANKEHEVEVEKAKLVEKNKEIQNLKGTLSAYVDEINGLSQTNLLNKNELAVKERDIENLKVEVEKTKKKLSENQNQLKMTSAKLVKADNECAKQYKMMTKKKEEICELKRCVEELQAVNLKYKQEVQMKGEENCNLQAVLKAATDGNLEKSKKLEKTQNELSEKILKSEELQKTLDERKAELEQAKTNLSAMENSLKELRIELHHARNKSFEQIKQIENMLSKFRKGEEEFQADLLECKKEFDYQRKMNSELQVQLDANVVEHKRKMENAQKKLSDLRLKADTLEGEKSSLSTALELEKQSTDNLQVLLKESILERDHYKDFFAKNQETINALEHQLLEYETNEKEYRAGFEKIIHDLKEKMLSQQAQLNVITTFLDEEEKVRVDRGQKYKALRDTFLHSASQSVCGGGGNTLGMCDVVSVSRQGGHCGQPGQGFGENDYRSPGENGTLAISHHVPQAESPEPSCSQGESAAESFQLDIRKNNNSAYISDTDHNDVAKTEAERRCQQCKRQFKKEKDFQRHLRTCNGDTNGNKCDDDTTDQEHSSSSGHSSACTRDTAKRKLDPEHWTSREIIHGVRPSCSDDAYFCTCGKKFDNKAALKSHLNRHSHHKRSDK